MTIAALRVPVRVAEHDLAFSDDKGRVVKGGEQDPLRNGVLHEMHDENASAAECAARIREAGLRPNYDIALAQERNEYEEKLQVRGAAGRGGVGGGSGGHVSGPATIIARKGPQSGAQSGVQSDVQPKFALRWEGFALASQTCVVLPRNVAVLRFFATFKTH